MKKHKEYEINTFEKLINVVNRENFERFSTDLLNWLNLSVALLDKIKAKHPKQCKEKTNWDILNSTFIWIDDGKKDQKIVLTNIKTGEIKELKIKKSI